MRKEIKIPFYSKKTNCIVCGIDLRKKKNENKKLNKGYSIVQENFLKIWKREKILTHPNDHKVCFLHKIINEPIKYRFKEKEKIDFSFLLDSIGKVVKSDKVEYEKENKYFLDFERLTEKQLKKTCGMKISELKKLSSLIDESNQKIFEFFTILKQGIS